VSLTVLRTFYVFIYVILTVTLCHLIHTIIHSVVTVTAHFIWGRKLDVGKLRSSHANIPCIQQRTILNHFCLPNCTLGYESMLLILEHFLNYYYVQIRDRKILINMGCELFKNRP
jgi:hypothetical protein